jgi:transcriptional regulator with XRE-family HTH domain
VELLLKLRCKLRSVRGERTLREIATASGVAIPTLSQLERGRLLPRDREIEPLERAYGVPFEAWFSPRTLTAMEEDDGT